jgi:hypothetical protein
MKTTMKIAALAAALAALPALAQQPTQAAQPNQGGKLGIGVGLTTAGTNTGTLFFVPINVAPKLRIEPFLGWVRSDIDAAPPGSGGAFFAPTPSGKSSDFSLGVGGFGVLPIVPTVDLYVGGRLSSEWQYFRDSNGNKWERRNTILAPVFGGEYLPHPRVALGAELMLGLVWFGDTDFPNGTSGAGGTGSFTQGTLFARFYLF